MESVIVTGGAGFIGSFLCEELIRRGFYVVAIDNLFRGKIENLKSIINHKNFKFVKMDLSGSIDFDLLMDVPKPVSILFHLAAINGTQYFYDIPFKVLDINTRITQNVLRIVEFLDAKYIVYTSSSEVYGDPIKIPTPEDHPILLNIFSMRDSYASSKAIGEFYIKLFCEKKKIPYLILRVFNLYGERMQTSKYGQVIPEFIKRALLEDNFYIIGDGSNTRSFCYIKDAVELMVKMVEMRLSDVINLGNDEEISIIELAKRIHRIIGREFKPSFLPPRPFDHKRRRPDISKLRSLFKDFNFTPLDVGLNKTIEFYKNLKDEGSSGK